MNLTEYRNSEDRHLFWRLSSGEHQNLLDEAIERIEDLENELNRIKDLVSEEDYDLIEQLLNEK